MAEQQQGTGVLAALVVMAGVNIIWGAAYPITKPALVDIPPIFFALARFVVACLVLVPLAPQATWSLISGPEKQRFFVLGFVGFCLTQMSQVAAIMLSPSSHLALMATTTPLWVAGLAYVWLKEPLTPRMLAGLGVAICGIILVLNPAGWESAPAGAILGYGIFLVSTVCWASYIVMGRSVMKAHPPVAATAAAAVYGVVSLIPFSVGEYLAGYVPHLTMAGISGILYTGLLVTVVGYLALFWALQRAASGRVSATMYFQPIAGVSVAWLLLGERPSIVFFIGAAVTLIGVYFVTSTAPVASPSITARGQ